MRHKFVKDAEQHNATAAAVDTAHMDPDDPMVQYSLDVFVISSAEFYFRQIIPTKMVLVGFSFNIFFSIFSSSCPFVCLRRPTPVTGRI